MKRKWILIFGIMLIIISFSFMLYPTISNFVNATFSRSAIDNYTDSVKSIKAAEKERILSAAENYNRELKNKVKGFSFSTKSFVNGYDDILNFDGVIGYIEIPKINVNLPVYHGSDENVLTKGAAHIPNTALPVGGKGNHTVVSAHTAYPTQVFFDNLPKLEIGDYIYIKILDEVLCYRVCETNIVEPTDTSHLNVDNNKDLLSLITCYPYAVNSHRLIVTAERTEIKGDVSTPDSINKNNKTNTYTIPISIAALCIFIIIIFIIKKYLISKKGGTK